MEARFDEIAQRLPEFHFGRFDVRFEQFSEVQAGRGFTIVEINGAGAESTHIWDRRTGLVEAWRDLMRQYRWLFEIGAANRARGFRPMSVSAFLRGYRREKFLTPQYPANRLNGCVRNVGRVPSDSCQSGSCIASDTHLEKRPLVMTLLACTPTPEKRQRCVSAAAVQTGTCSIRPCCWSPCMSCRAPPPMQSEPARTCGM